MKKLNLNDFKTLELSKENYKKINGGGGKESNYAPPPNGNSGNGSGTGTGSNEGSDPDWWTDPNQGEKDRQTNP